ncbi:hypothetical protein QBC40DRAFT_27365 [Triangularia verruculosa]|uniref:Uncharacterized protein n=1 Tax=Triangularia verruculosa TaxID=2587418 RepID=A0AAN6XN20_9PEZI|nr:hypothetical protein QBC40DRAFT_27365 [Triangularia verruculosa]
MMPTMLNTHMGGVPPHQLSHHQMAQMHQPPLVYPVDPAMLNELSRQLGSTKRYSQHPQPYAQRPNHAMRVSKPGSANNSPRSSMQSRRRTLIGEGFQGRFPQQQQQAVESAYLPTPASEASNESFYGHDARRARPVSWHPSPQYSAQTPLYPPQTSSMLCSPYPAYSEAEMLATMHQLPPTPAIYSGYTSPAEGFSPLSLPYSSFTSQQPVYSPQVQAQQQAPMYQPAPPVTTEAMGWNAYATAGPTHSNTMMMAVPQHTAPPTPEDFACPPPLNLNSYGSLETTPSKVDSLVSAQVVQVQEDESEEEGEILYGMGLYDPPSHTRQDLHRSTIFSLLGGPAPTADENKGLGLKLEESWEPPVSDDEEEEEDGEGDDE